MLLLKASTYYFYSTFIQIHAYNNIDIMHDRILIITIINHIIYI